ncbi:MAG: PhoH family protein [Parachlamydiales bacterium]
MTSSRKNYVVDTNVFLHDPEAILKFEGDRVTVPVTVLEELEKMQKFRDELGRNARITLRLLESLRKTSEGDFHSGLTLKNGSEVRIALQMKSDYPGLSLSIKENRILLTAYLLKEQGEAVIFVSKDLTQRVKAAAIGLEVEDYQKLKVSFEQMHRGIRELQVDKETVDRFLKDGAVQLPLPEGVVPGEYIHMIGENGTATGKYHAKKGVVEAIPALPRDIWGIEPLNLEQRCALDLLLRDDVHLVTLLGPAGTGKTMLALASGMRAVFDENLYSRMVVTRPIMPLGRDIGYLPGTKEEKLHHWMQPIEDNLEFLCQATGNQPSDTLRWILDSDKIEMEAVTYIRGRSLPKVYMIIDEAQNLTPHEIKTVISRAGKGTKVVLTGDPTQIDNPYLDQDSNGLTYTVSRMKESPLFGHVFLERTERSRLAALAAELL